ncbi:COMM domain-containing protein, putative [Pediculus humanus corporis]|uniref:COMM domain-containing protein, putative n=1 Tax=Pediculus humanus subsp. corporis TaxID=121224 RepID=E0VBY8_PEDHC|nr:COMM domain-containing protein, putative [Pediculus humanus corporis]EEB10894.1 COMM domain-containing protein, putative [Pediculus humanus corporis]
MTDLIISDCHKNDLKFLQGKSQNSNLQIDVKQVQSIVEGLAHLFVEAGKFKLTKTAFEEVILNLGLPDNVIEIIYNEYLLQTKVIDFGLSTIEIQHLQYKNIDWRFDIQVSIVMNKLM